MIDRIKNFMTVCFAAGFVIICVAGKLISGDKDVSESERRKLAQFPQVNASAVIDGTFMEEFDRYSQDQFIFRDELRTVKACVSLYGLGKMDNNGYFMAEGQISRIEYPLDIKSLDRAVNHIKDIYDIYLADKDINVYTCVIPDKNYYIASNNGYLCFDYDILIKTIQQDLGFATYIDIMDKLDKDSYYATDIHWKQEKIVNAADHISKAMGGYSDKELKQMYHNELFRGVYYGQMALPVHADTLVCLTWDGMDGCSVYDYETSSYIDIYDETYLNSNDAYSVYLSGSKSLLELTNADSGGDKELIIFRDSFGSSIAPLLLRSYSKITLVDTRYISAKMLDKFIEFDNQDVLFMYSTSVLGNATSFR